MTPARWILSLALATAVAGTPGQRVRAAIDFPASWQPRSYAQVRAQVAAWRDAASLPSEALRQVDDLWPATEPAAGEDVDLLDRLSATFAAAYPSVHELVRFCQTEYTIPQLPDAAWLATDEAPPFVRDNLRLYYARWLAQHGLYEEALAELESMKLDAVADPASLLFYRMVAHHQLVEPDEARAALIQLMEQNDALPRRFQRLAQLVERDLASLEDESLDHIARRMNDVRRRLNYGRAGAKVQLVEKQVVDSLDKKIDKLEQQQQQQQQQQQMQQSGSPQPSQPMQDSQLPGMKAPMKVDQRDIGHTAGWGDLPPKQRERALQQIGRDFPAHYRDLIEHYFRELASEPEPTSEN